MSGEERHEHNPELVGTHTCAGGADHLPGVIAAQQELDELGEKGFVAINPDEYDYLQEAKPAGFAGVSDARVENLVLPYPTSDVSASVDSASLLQDYEAESMRTLKVMEEADYHLLMKQAYPEMFETQASLPWPRYTWLPTKHYTPANHNASNVYYVVEHTAEGSYSGAYNTLRFSGGVSSHTVFDIEENPVNIACLASTKDITWTNAVWTYNKFSASNNERAGFAGVTNYPDSHYWATARWNAKVFQLYRIPFQLGGVPNKKSSAYRAGLLGHIMIPYPSTHVDPGYKFDFEKLLNYMIRIRDGNTSPQKPDSPKGSPKPPEPKQSPEKKYKMKRVSFFASGDKDTFAARMAARALNRISRRRNDQLFAHAITGPQNIRYGTRILHEYRKDYLSGVVCGGPAKNLMNPDQVKALEDHPLEGNLLDAVGDDYRDTRVLISWRLSVICDRLKLGGKEKRDVLSFYKIKVGLE